MGREEEWGELVRVWRDGGPKAGMDRVKTPGPAGNLIHTKPTRAVWGAVSANNVFRYSDLQKRLKAGAKNKPVGPLKVRTAGVLVCQWRDGGAA